MSTLRLAFPTVLILLSIAANGCGAAVGPGDATVASDAVVPSDARVDTDRPDIVGDALRPPRVPLNHRPMAVACEMTRPAGAVCMASSGPPSECTTDSQCGMGTNGRCGGNPHDGCHCTYDRCFADGDCMTGGPCSCRIPSRGAQGSNVCMAGNCRVDADCGANGYCSPTFDTMCGAYFGVVGYYCHTAGDTCIDDADCPGMGMFGAPPYCAYQRTTGIWSCSDSQCAG